MEIESERPVDTKQRHRGHQFINDWVRSRTMLATPCATVKKTFDDCDDSELCQILSGVSRHRERVDRARRRAARNALRLYR